MLASTLSLRGRDSAQKRRGVASFSHSSGEETWKFDFSMHLNHIGAANMSRVSVSYDDEWEQVVVVLQTNVVLVLSTADGSVVCRPFSLGDVVPLVSPTEAVRGVAFVGDALLIHTSCNRAVVMRRSTLTLSLLSDISLANRSVLPLPSLAHSHTLPSFPLLPSLLSFLPDSPLPSFPHNLSLLSLSLVFV